MNNKKNPLKKTTFIGKEKGDTQNNYWAVPDSPDFSQGLEVGERIAREYLIHIGNTETAAATLPQIIIDLSKHSPFSPGRRGQITGFFVTIESQLTSPKTK